MDPAWRAKNLVCSMSPEGDGITVEEQPMAPIREDLLVLFAPDELAKYLTPEELATLPTSTASTGGSGS
jgi:succinate dehydrogenase / fumarate reductase flavoprotein subunit